MWILLDKFNTVYNLRGPQPTTKGQRDGRVALLNVRYPLNAPFSWVDWSESDGALIPVESVAEKAVSGKTAVEKVAVTKTALSQKGSQK